MSRIDHAAVERELTIHAGPETIWPLLVNERDAVRWMGLAAALDPRPGGGYRVEVTPGNVVGGTFLELDPPRRLVFTWRWETGPRNPSPAPASTVEIELLPHRGDAVLRLRHRDLEGAVEVERHTHGWDHYLPRLALLAAGGDPGRDPWQTSDLR